MSKRFRSVLVILAVFAGGVVSGWVASSAASEESSTSTDRWLVGTVDEKFQTIERHLRGLDQTMVEIGYRFTELYWAGKNLNWVYAQYQLDKIALTLELGVERRPKRAASAAPFLADEISVMREAIARKEEEAFQSGIERLRSACMRCHVEEKV